MAPAFNHAPSMVEKIILKGTFSGRFNDRDHAISVFKSHVEEVKRSISEEKLLIYEVSEEWQPLCGFLNAEIPDEPFPHLNERGEFPKIMRRGLLRAAAPRLVTVLAAGIAVLAVARLARPSSPAG